MTTVIAFLVTLGVLVVVHEYGHYRVAVACGVKVLRFSVGFGRVLWSRRRGPDQTEFALCALPLGGYVRMLDSREDAVNPDEAHRAFDRRPLRQRVAIVAAGPLANLLLAVLLYALSHWIGVEEPQAILSTPVAGSVAEKAGLASGDEVIAAADEDGAWQPVDSFNDLSWLLTQAALNGESPVRLQLRSAGHQGDRQVTLDLSSLASSDVDGRVMSRLGFGPPLGEPVIGKVIDGGPAAAAGLRSGDRVLSVDGRALADAFALREVIAASHHEGQPRPMRLAIERNGTPLAIVVTPRLIDDAGRTLARIDAMVGAPPALVTVRKGPIDGIVAGAQRTWDVSTLTLKMLGRMLIGEASLKNLSGPITIADVAGQSAERGLAYYLSFLALVSISLGVLNLLPLPMLDGGHLMYYLFEGVTGRPVSEVWLRWLQRGGAFVLLLLMSLALSNDVARLLGLQ
jgi:regulator of sigma E protease